MTLTYIVYHAKGERSFKSLSAAQQYAHTKSGARISQLKQYY
jgi:hypothetical protein